MSSGSPSVDELFDLLSHPRRRAILLLIALSTSGGVALRKVAETVYAVEHDVIPTTAPTRKVVTVPTNINRSHLDALEDGDLIVQGPHDRLSAGSVFGLALCVIALSLVEL